jgi:hypothetical protein
MREVVGVATGLKGLFVALYENLFCYFAVFLI